MENQLKTLFKGQDPSVRLFHKKIMELTAEEGERYYLHAYSLGLLKWEAQSTAYRNFLKRLIQHDRQRFLDFIHRNMLGELRYTFRDPVLAARVLGLMELDKEKQRPSDNHLAFCFQLGFDSPVRVNVMEKIIASRMFMPEELQDIKGKAIVNTGQI